MSQPQNTTAAPRAAVAAHRASMRRKPMPALRVDRASRAAEVGVQRGTARLHRRNDRNRNARGNQTVFDGRSAGFIADETRYQIHHWKPPLASYTLIVHPNGRK